MVDEGLSAGAVARRLGIAVTTLRTWHQRYGLGPSRHVPGRHRRYTLDDLVRLETMRRLTSQGVPAAEAARWATRPAAELRLLNAAEPGRFAPSPPPTQSPPAIPSDAAAPPPPAANSPSPAPPLPATPSEAVPSLPAADSPSPAPLPLAAPSEATDSPSPPAVPSSSPSPPAVPSEASASSPPVAESPSASAPHGGGFAIPLGRAVPAARGLARAAMRLDSPAMRDLIALHVRRHGVIATWDSVLRPVLVGIGERHASTSTLVEVEHLVSRTVSEVLGAVPRPGADGPVPSVLLACADEEQHSLPLEALAAALAETGVACRLLGARVPPGALRGALARTGPRAVVVWAQMAQNADPAQLTALVSGTGRPPLIVAAGPGWAARGVPAGVSVPASLAEAVTLLTLAARPAGGATAAAG